jgi:CheY-like chemotaxis protein
MDIQMPIMNGYEAIKRIREFNEDVIIIHKVHSYSQKLKKTMKLVVTDIFQNH